MDLSYNDSPSWKIYQQRGRLWTWHYLFCFWFSFIIFHVRLNLMPVDRHWYFPLVRKWGMVRCKKHWTCAICVVLSWVDTQLEGRLPMIYLPKFLLETEVWLCNFPVIIYTCFSNRERVCSISKSDRNYGSDQTVNFGLSWWGVIDVKYLWLLPLKISIDLFGIINIIWTFPR